jgi:hypothetical protein
VAMFPLLDVFNGNCLEKERVSLLISTRVFVQQVEGDAKFSHIIIVAIAFGKRFGDNFTARI